MSIRNCILGLMAAVAAAFGYLCSYEVTPTQASWTGWTRTTPGQDWVGNTFVANFDSLAEVSLFTGELGSGAYYRLDVYDAESNDRVAHQYNVPPAGDHQWLRFHTIIPDGKFIRGREYLAEFTRPNDSINYYFGQATNGGPYAYGKLVVAGVSQDDKDLCLRIDGKARVGDQFAVQSLLGMAPPDTSLRYVANWRTCIQRA